MLAKCSGSGLIGVALSVCGLFLSQASVLADPMYTVTDLGASPSLTFNSPNGSPVSDPFTAPTASFSVGNLTYAFQTTPLSSNGENVNGISYGVSRTYDHTGIFVESSTPYYTLPSQNGLPGDQIPIVMFGNGLTAQSAVPYKISGTEFTIPYFNTSLTMPGVSSLNSQNQMLILGAKEGFTDTWLYDVNTHILTDLAALPGFPSTLGSAVISDVLPIMIDNQGRILLTADYYTPGTGQYPEDTLLLTPEGLSSNPIVTAPEPSTLMAWSLVSVAVGIRYVSSKRRKPDSR